MFRPLYQLPLVLLLLSGSAAAQTDRVDYVIDCSAPGSGRIGVSMTYTPRTDARQTLFMPNWTPGAYRRVEFGRRVVDLEVEDAAGGAVAVEYTEPGQWSFAASGPVAVTYEVRHRGLTASHCAFTGTSVFLGVEGELDRPARVRFVTPEGWEVGTGMARTDDPQVFTVPSYDDLVDCPVEIGEFMFHELDVKGVDVEVVVHAGSEAESAVREILLPQIEAIFHYQLELMRDIPFDRYVFLYHLRRGGMGGSGLEHMNSTTIDIGVPALTRSKVGASITAHELFHAWNVKRLRSAPIMPYDYSGVPQLDSLWFHEGVTDYYAALTLRRAGITTDEELLAEIAGSLANLDVTNNYYTRGQALGFLLDCQIRVATGNTKSLDDVMRYLNFAYAKPGVPFQESAELGRVLSGFAERDLTAFVERVCVGKEPCDIARIAAAAGFDYELRTGRRSPYLGVNAASREEGGVILRQVIDGTSAARAGLRNNDVILAWGGEELGPRDWPAVVRRSTPGEQIPLRVQRGDEVLDLVVELGYRETRTGRLAVAEGSPAAPIARSWLEGRADVRPSAVELPAVPEPVPAARPASPDDWF